MNMQQMVAQAQKMQRELQKALAELEKKECIFIDFDGNDFTRSIHSH